MPSPEGTLHASMDDFGLDRGELTGTLVSMDFGSGGRIQQLWVADPMMRDEGEEFQFVLPPMSFGEEFSEDYNPGTILLGARSNADEPWILSRNTFAQASEDPEDPMVVSFEYEFSLLPEIKATGRFFEIPGPIPQTVWHVKFRNEGRVTLEIGELGFPLALNNVYEGFPNTDRGIEELYKDRLYIHPFIGGAASYLFAQRLNAEPPGLAIVPGEGTSWEFMMHVPASLNTGFRWEGIPVVYVHSRALVERENIAEWFNGHTSRILEPGDELEVQMRFLAASRDRVDGLHLALATVRRPTMRLFPGAVSPIDVGIAVDVAGCTPAEFTTSRDADLETDSDADGGYCHIRPRQPGPFKLTIHDTQGRESVAHLFGIEPIEQLIQARARWIVKNQVHDDAGSNLNGAILPARLDTAVRLTTPEAYAGPFGIESSLSDALFLAEKNTIYPDRQQIATLENYIDTFLRGSVQNPANGTVGASLVDSTSTAVHFGQARLYPMVSALHHTMFRIAKDAGTKTRDAGFYLCQAAATLKAMGEHADPSQWRASGLPLMTLLPAIEADLNAAGMESPMPWEKRAADIGKRRYPFASRSLWDTEGFDEAHAAAIASGNFGLAEGALSAAFAARSTAPSWWWHGSEKRWLDDSEPAPHPAMADKGEMCLGPGTAGNAALFLRGLVRDADPFPDPILRMAFGGLLAIWAMVREDGAASTGFCPDPASRNFGIAPLTGTAGLGLYHYLRLVGSYVIPSRHSGVQAFGCTFDAKEQDDGVVLEVIPWDGVGRRVVVRQLGIEANVEGGRIVSASFHSRKRHAVIELDNPSSLKRKAKLTVEGLWGTQFQVNGKKEHTPSGALSVEQTLAPNETAKIEIKVLG